MNRELTVGITDARTSPTFKFWETFFHILGITPVYSDIPPEEAIDKAKMRLSNSEQYCIFRKIDFGQHIDLIEKGCNCLIIPSTRSENMLTCNSSRFMAEHLSRIEKKIDILNFRIHTDDFNKQKNELRRLGEFFTEDKNKIKSVIDAWPLKFEEKNAFLNLRNERKLNILVIGRIYYYFDYRRSNSPYINMLCKKLNCNIYTLNDFKESSLKDFKDAYTLLTNSYPNWHDNVERYWNMPYIVRSLIGAKKIIDGIVFIKDPWCECAREESPIIVDVMQHINIPYYLIDFELGAFSSIDTILESFMEILLLRKENESTGN